MKIFISICLLVFSLLSCTKNNGTKGFSVSPPAKPFSPVYNIDTLDYHTDFDSIATIAGAVSEILEVSGIDKCLNRPGALWVHNDGGDESLIFLLDGINGKRLLTYSLNNTLNIDWEDLSTYRDLNSGTNYIYIGDIGNNTNGRKNFTIYKLTEPNYVSNKANDTIDYNGIVESYIFQYPEGNYNAETIMTDPLNGKIILATYTQDITYIFDLNLNNEELKFLGTLPISKITGGDISDDRSRIIMKTFRDILVWEIKYGESIASAFARTPKKAPYVGEPQGEAICWYNGGYFTLSEKVGEKAPDLYYYHKN